MSIQHNHPSNGEWEKIYSMSGFSHKNYWPDSSIVAFMTRTFGRKEHHNTKVLDLGCGWGNNLRFLYEEGYDVTGLDGSTTACEHCQTITRNVVCGSFSNLPFADGIFDAVVDRNSVQCNTLDEITEILKEIYRVLKPGGVFYSILLSYTNQPRSFHAYYLESPESRLERYQVMQLFSPFSSILLDEERRTYRGGELTLECWHVIAKK